MPARTPVMLPELAVTLTLPPELMPRLAPLTVPAFDRLTATPEAELIPLLLAPVPEIVAPLLFVMFEVPPCKTMPEPVPVTRPLFITMALVPPLLMPMLPEIVAAE